MVKLIVLGGLGFIGRNFVEYVLKNNLAEKIRIADKCIPANAYLSNEHQDMVEKDPRIEFKQVNLSREASVKAVFEGEWDYVVNLAGETKFNQAPDRYKENILQVSLTCAKAAAEAKVKMFVEVSTSHVYKAGSSACNEGSEIIPRNEVARMRYEAENALKSIPGLNLVIVRPSVVYGNGDTIGLTHLFVVGAVYKQKKKPMKFLWSPSFKYNTVHVLDVCSALWFVLTKAKPGDVYNIANDDTTIEAIAKIVKQVFSIDVKWLNVFEGAVMGALKKKDIAEGANDKHLAPWSELCKIHKIVNTPLTPYLDEELIFNEPLYIDGTAITKAGFEYKHTLTADEIKKVLKYYVELKYFPEGLF